MKEEQKRLNVVLSTDDGRIGIALDVPLYTVEEAEDIFRELGRTIGLARQHRRKGIVVPAERKDPRS